MTFTSIVYLLFLPLVWLIYQLTPDRYRWLLLLAASYVFYAALKIPYLLAVLLLVTAVSYVAGMLLGAATDPTQRKVILWCGVGGNLLVLVILKYLPFLSENMRALIQRLGVSDPITSFNPLVAIGVSYFIFQAIAYLTDVYLEIDSAERHFGRFALYMAFFPKLLQGPIERGNDLLPQLREPYQFDYDQARWGLVIFTWGLFKKVVIADRLEFFVEPVYSNVHAWSGLPLLIATYAYAFQLYFDFSGYTDMALGSARLFNIRLTQNFNSPYLAISVADFWRRWHISFSRWILDYIFKPLQMEWRGWGTQGTALALVVAFLVSGIWHGASWGFVTWGGLHGTFLAVSVYWKPYQKKLHLRLGIAKTRLLTAWQVFATFNLVCFAWIFFRTATVGDAWYVITHLVIANDTLPVLSMEFVKNSIFIGQSSAEFAVVVLGLLVMMVIGMIFKRQRVYDYFLYLKEKTTIVRWAHYVTLCLSIVCLGSFGASHFIYYRF
jgi:D-alanyl-lipoteichoic acid acyltransferase DltB (MBOAT superfamily)